MARVVISSMCARYTVKDGNRGRLWILAGADGDGWERRELVNIGTEDGNGVPSCLRGTRRMRPAGTSKSRMRSAGLLAKTVIERRRGRTRVMHASTGEVGIRVTREEYNTMVAWTSSIHAHPIQEELTRATDDTRLTCPTVEPVVSDTNNSFASL